VNSTGSMPILNRRMATKASAARVTMIRFFSARWAAEAQQRHPQPHTDRFRKGDVVAKGVLGLS
jgi:hypothetical protein